MCCIFFGPRSCIPRGYFLQMRGQIRAVGCSLSSAPHWFSQGGHSIVLSKEDAGIRSQSLWGQSSCCPAALLPLSSHAALLLHFSEINKSSQSYVSLRLRREPLIKQLSCWSEVTLILGLRERKPNGAVFMLCTEFCSAGGSCCRLSKKGSQCVIEGSQRLTTPGTQRD